MRTHCARTLLVVLTGIVLCSVVSRGQAQTNFPSSPEVWINSSPLSTSSLKGKAVFLWFFEEGCPTCREKWPVLIETAQKNADKPILFLAVNSGNPRAEVQSYAQQNRITWPILVDSSRQFEKQCGVREISLKNVMQVQLLMPNGVFQSGRWSDIDGSITTALEGASWNIDPTTIPAPLQPAWRSIEFGDYGTAGKLVSKGLLATDSAVKQAAQSLQAVVKKEIDAQAAEAKAKLDAGAKWNAYSAYVAIGQRFPGFELPAEVAANAKALAADPQVKAAQAAAKNLDLAKKALQNSSATARKRGLTMLDKVIADLPDTDLAAEAAKLREQYGK